MSQTTDTPADDAFNVVANALNTLPPTDAAALLSFMLAVVARTVFANLPTEDMKAELAALVGRAVDASQGGFDPAQVAG